MTGFNLPNEIIGIVAGLVTTFLIPWLNRRLHTSIQDTPQTTAEITDLLDRALRLPPPVPGDLGANPFSSAPRSAPPSTNTFPNEDGAK